MTYQRSVGKVIKEHNVKRIKTKLVNKIPAVIKLSRLTILPGGILAYSLGAAMGNYHAGGFDWRAAGLGLLATIIANLSAHYADEYADQDIDRLTRKTTFSGGSGVLPSGALSPNTALFLAVFTAIITLLLALFLVYSGLLPLISVGILVLGLVLGWFYSMPPVAFERWGMGEPVNALIGGILMPLMGYTVQTGTLSLTALLTLLPVFFMVFASLLGIHWADREADQIAGKRSLVVQLGNRTRALQYTLTLLAFGLVIAYSGWIHPQMVSLFYLTAMPFAAWASVTITRTESPVPASLAMGVFLIAGAAGWGVA
jgi:1,4-dihydroxy-2-naphthoate polyprenyltransferase